MMRQPGNSRLFCVCTFDCGFLAGVRVEWLDRFFEESDWRSRFQAFRHVVHARGLHMSRSFSASLKARPTAGRPDH